MSKFLKLDANEIFNIKEIKFVSLREAHSCIEVHFVHNVNYRNIPFNTLGEAKDAYLKILASLDNRGLLL